MKVLIAAVLAAGALTVPGAGQAVAAGIDQPLAGPGQAAAMQEAFGLTEQQMTARLKSETDAAKLLPTAQRAAGAEYGGAWYDAATSKLVVGLAGSSRTAAVQATGVETIAVPKSAAVLDKQKNAVDKLAGKSVPAAVSGWAADPKTGSVVVNVQAGKRSRRSTPSWRRWPRPVR